MHNQDNEINNNQTKNVQNKTPRNNQQTTQRNPVIIQPTPLRQQQILIDQHAFKYRFDLNIQGEKSTDDAISEQSVIEWLVAWFDQHKKIFIRICAYFHGGQKV